MSIYGISKKKAFTLVELIVVITILAILATIGFVSYSGYLAGTRDTNRTSQLKAMSDGLELYRTRHDLPLPDDKVDIKSSGATIAYQGYIGKNILETIEYTTEGKDPKDGTYFSYYLTKDKKYYQLMAFLEEDNSTTTAGILNKTYAVDYSVRYPKVYGKKLGILTDTNNTPIQETGITSLDVANTTDTYVARFTDNEKVEGTGSVLVKINPIASCKRIKQLRGGSQNGVYTINPTGSNPFKVYCDMITDGGGWTLVGIFNKEGMPYNIGDVGDVTNPKNTGVKLSDIKINSLNGKQFKFQSIGTKECSEFLYSKSFIFDYSTTAKASTKGLYSKIYKQNLDGYINNGGYGNGYVVSHWGERDVWLRDEGNGGTRWYTVSGNPCGYTNWFDQASNLARPDIKMFVK